MHLYWNYNTSHHYPYNFSWYFNIMNFLYCNSIASTLFTFLALFNNRSFSQIFDPNFRYVSFNNLFTDSRYCPVSVTIPKPLSLTWIIWFEFWNTCFDSLDIFGKFEKDNLNSENIASFLSSQWKDYEWK